LGTDGRVGVRKREAREGGKKEGWDGTEKGEGEGGVRAGESERNGMG